MLTVRHCSLSWSRHTSGGLSKMTLLRFSSPHPVYLLPPSKWSSVCAHTRAVEVVEECRGATLIQASSLVGQTHTARPRSFHQSSLCCVHTKPTCTANSAFSSLCGFCCHFLKQGGRCPNSPTRNCAPTQNAAVSTAHAISACFLPLQGLSHLILWFVLFFRCKPVFYLCFICMSY